MVVEWAGFRDKAGIIGREKDLPIIIKYTHMDKNTNTYSMFSVTKRITLVVRYLIFYFSLQLVRFVCLVQIFLVPICYWWTMVFKWSTVP